MWKERRGVRTKEEQEKKKEQGMDSQRVLYYEQQ